MSYIPFLSPIDLNKNEIKNVCLQPRANVDIPTSPANGQVYYNTTDHLLYIWDEGLNLWISAEYIRLNYFRAPDNQVDFNQQKIINLADPVNPQDGVNKRYADSLAAGLKPKDACRLATTGNVDLATGGLLSLDGVQTVAGDRILVKDQSVPTQNGIYIAASGAWARAADFDGSPTSEVSGGSFVFVTEGTDYANTGWILQGSGELTLGTDNIVFVQFSGAGAITAGTGMTKSGDTLNVGGGKGILANTDDMQVDVGNGLEFSDDTLTAKVQVKPHSDGSISVSADGVKVSDSFIAGNSLVKEKTYVLDTAVSEVSSADQKTWTVTHSFNTRAVDVFVYEASGSYRQVQVAVAYTTVNAVTLMFAAAAGNGNYVVTLKAKQS